MHSKKWIAIFGAGLVLALSSVAALAQSDSLSGKYAGVAKSASIGDIPVTVTIKNTNGKVSGTIDTPQGPLPITDGTVSSEGKISVKFDAGGNEGTLTGQMKEGKIVGEWSLAGQSGTIELKKDDGVAKAEPPKTEPPKTDSKPAAAGDPITGDWNGSIDAGGNNFGFTLKLKLDGEKVSGEAVSDMGTAPISKGSWMAGKLAIVLETPNANITMNGAMQEGKLVGDFDFAGQAQGKWEAKKK